MEMPPEVRIGILSFAVVGVIGILLLVFGDRPELAAAIRRLFAGRTSVMSSDAVDSAAADWSANRSIDQSVQTGLDAQTSAPASPGLELDADEDSPDMDAEHTTFDTPRISRYLTDEEFIVFLATQKLRNGKDRMTANAIVKAVGGDRTKVLAIVRQVREGPAEFPQLTDEQAALRRQLQLDQR